MHLVWHFLYSPIPFLNHDLVNVIKGALQPISIPPSDTFLSTLGGDAWHPAVDQALVMEGNNPKQNAQTNLKASAITRTVGGMATHWTCACRTS